MIRALYTGASGMIAQQAFVDNTANNLANVNTAGFKRTQVDFQDLFYATLQAPGLQVVEGQSVPTGLQLGNGVRIAATTGIFTQGPLDNTGNPLDIAIDGVGFFQLTAPDGTLRYTRDGSFSLNATGQMVNPDGLPLEPAITIPANALSIAISPTGVVTVMLPNQTNPTTVGTIQLARFVNPAGLSRQGSNLFQETAASGTPTVATPGQDGMGLMREGFLERSNVEAIEELINLILGQRAFEFNTRSVTVADQMLQSANDLVR